MQISFDYNVKNVSLKGLAIIFLNTANSITAVATPTGYKSKNTVYTSVMSEISPVQVWLKHCFATWRVPLGWSQ